MVRMPVTLAGQLVVAISSRALFDFEEENRVFEASDDRAYMQLQLAAAGPRRRTPGVAFSLVNKLLAFNTPSGQRVEVVILSRNDPVSGMRVFRSAQHYGLPIQRGVFTRGESPWRYLRAAGGQPVPVHQRGRRALGARTPACRRRASTRSRRAPRTPTRTRCASPSTATPCCSPTRPSGSSRRRGWTPSRATSASAPARRWRPARSSRCSKPCTALQHEPAQNMRIRTALVTARSAPAHERAIRTLMDWHIEVDEAMFLGGLPKGEFLREFEPDFFFDDQTGHIENAAPHVPAGHVAAGIVNG